MIFRVAFGAATLVSGIGLIAYVALKLLLPKDTGEPAWMEGRSRVTTIVVTGILSVIALSTLSGPGFLIGPGLFGVAAVSVLGLALYRGFFPSIKEDPAKAIARATLALLAFVAMLGRRHRHRPDRRDRRRDRRRGHRDRRRPRPIAAGLLGGPRWLILPVVVLVMPLAVVSAADIDLTGGVGERTYRPDSVAQLRPEYKLGVGQVGPRPAPLGPDRADQRRSTCGSAWARRGCRSRAARAC